MPRKAPIFRKRSEEEYPSVQTPAKETRKKGKMRLNSVLELDAQKYPDHSKTFRASSDSICGRKYFLRQQQGTYRTWDMWGEYYTDIGTCIHEWFYKLLERTRMRYITEYEYTVRVNGTKLHGFVDVIGEDPVTKELFIWDVKSAGTIPRTPYKSYCSQLAMYSLITGIQDISFVVIPRNNPRDLDILAVPHQERYLKEVASNIAEGTVSVTKGVYPPPSRLIANKGDCKYCAFIGKCWYSETALDSDSDLSEINQDQVSLISSNLLKGMDTRRAQMQHVFEAVWDEQQEQRFKQKREKEKS
jgi:hypothetical protein